MPNSADQPIGETVKDWTPPKPPSREPIAGRYCTVELLDPRRHCESLHAANALDREGRIWTYLPYGPFEDIENYRLWLTKVSRSTDPLFFAIVDNATGDAVGVASYLRIAAATGVIEVGHINLSPRLQRTRAATEAMFLMMSNVFEQGYRRYEWKCDSLNAGSRAAAQRLGFSYEGIFRQATMYKGRNRDTAWYSIIDREWPTLYDAFQRWLDPSNFDASGKQKVRLSDLTARGPG